MKYNIRAKVCKWKKHVLFNLTEDVACPQQKIHNNVITLKNNRTENEN